MWRWGQSQAVDVRPVRGVEMAMWKGVLIQMGRVPREGAVETGALEVSVVRLGSGTGGGSEDA